MGVMVWFCWLAWGDLTTWAASDGCCPVVGAAGNLINDYFDVREDRINKPNRALVGRLVKRRVYDTHWGFTIAALW